MVRRCLFSPKTLALCFLLPLTHAGTHAHTHIIIWSVGLLSVCSFFLICAVMPLQLLFPPNFFFIVVNVQSGWQEFVLWVYFVFIHFSAVNPFLVGAKGTFTDTFDWKFVSEEEPLCLLDCLPSKASGLSGLISRVESGTIMSSVWYNSVVRSDVTSSINPWLLPLISCSS